MVMKTITPEYLMNLAVEHEQSGDNMRRFYDAEDALAAAEAMEAAGLSEIKFWGPYGDASSIKKGSKVRIPKGTVIKTTMPNPSGRGFVTKVAGRTYTITVEAVHGGYIQRDMNHPPLVRNPRVVWAGTGGYWHDVDLNMVELIEE